VGVRYGALAQLEQIPPPPEEEKPCLIGQNRPPVESYVGAIALAYLFAQGVLHFVNIFASPIAGGTRESNMGHLRRATASAAGLPLEAALPELIRFFLLLLLWFFLLR
jgi:hypothetical protein